MATYRDYGMSVAQPSDYTRHGEGNFLVQYWGKGFTFTKNGRDWYTVYNPGKRYRINQSLYLNNTTENDNNKIINSGYATVKYSFTGIIYAATATVGTRVLSLIIIDTAGNSTDYFYAFPPITASQTKRITLTPSGSMVEGLDVHNYLQPIAFDFYSKHNSAIKIYDKADIDSNDDMHIYTRGWGYSKKLKDYEFMDCTDFAIEYQADSDLVGTSYGWFLNVLPLP